MTVTQYLGQINLYAFNFAPTGTMECKGQILPIAGNEDLFALIGNNFGGEGRSNFALPNLEGKSPNPHVGYFINVEGTNPPLQPRS